MFYKNTKKKLFCIHCYKPGMKGLHGALCCEFSKNKCLKKASWGYPEGCVLTCKTHKQTGMINVNVQTCHFIDKNTNVRCTNNAEYAFNKKRIYCELHCDKKKMIFKKQRNNNRKIKNNNRKIKMSRN